MFFQRYPLIKNADVEDIPEARTRKQLNVKRLKQQPEHGENKWKKLNQEGRAENLDPRIRNPGRKEAMQARSVDRGRNQRET